ncbi:hypothetical protein [Chryseobacterium indoltheticum]|uniref:hypothetical protein n=1 Tax=Chryseobacterium indoltheticum TaxID=254 RepID=UPI001913B2FE|nr:hypothetical protein [Chryseobacterium indoltheticum]QQQ30228.1 hypothetical protein JJL46_09625 [Chryseobacterium indoltheticum]
MRTKILLLFLLGWVGMAYGQVDNPYFKIITGVKISNDTITVKGFRENGNFDKFIKKMTLGYVYSNKTVVYYPKFSLLTLPFKIRPKTNDYSSSAYSGLDNIGLNIDFSSLQWDKYFSTGRSSSSRVSAGILLAPAVEEMTIENTKNNSANKKQLFISTGITLNYSYNKLTFTIVPVGFDFATNTAGKEWVYNKRYWWGFGIGLDLKILENLIDK